MQKGGGGMGGKDGSIQRVLRRISCLGPATQGQGFPFHRWPPEDWSPVLKRKKVPPKGARLQGEKGGGRRGKDAAGKERRTSSGGKALRISK